MYNFSFIKEVLKNYDYPFQDCGNYLKCPAFFRGGKDNSSVSIYDKIVIDHVTGNKYSHNDFISLVTGIKEKEKLEELLKAGSFPPQENKPPLIKQQKIFDKSLLDKLEPNYDYWLNRGISKEVLIEYGGGVYHGKGIFNNRYVFPIFDLKNERLIGLAGRCILGENNKSKWILNGEKKFFQFPVNLYHNIIKEKQEIFLVESIGDSLALSVCGQKNNVVLFGIDCSWNIVNYLLTLERVKINICVNNDETGKNAAQKIRSRLKKYFDLCCIKIIFPSEFKDWNVFLLETNKNEVCNFLLKQFKISE